MIKKWNLLPDAKKIQLASLYQIIWYGVSDEDMENQLEEKLPADIKKVLADDKVEKAEKVETQEIVSQETEVQEEVFTCQCGKEYKNEKKYKKHLEKCLPKE